MPSFSFHLSRNFQFSRCRLSKALVHPPPYSTTARRIPSVAGYWSTISSLIVSNVLLLLYFFQAPSSSSKFYLLLFSRCRFSASTLPSSLLLNNNRPIPSVAVQPPVSEHRPTEGKEGEDTDRAKLQNCQRPIERKNEAKTTVRLYFFVGNNRETELVSGEKIIVESISWVKQFDNLSKRDIHVWP